MKQNVFLKSILRRPIRSVFLLLLLAAISFGFIGKAVEYVIVQRETQRLEGYYRSIGELSKFKTVEGMDFPQAFDQIKDSPELAFLDIRRYSSGVMEGIYNADIDGTSSDSASNPQFNRGVYNLDVFFYGTLTELSPYVIEDGEGKEITAGYQLHFLVDKVVEGSPAIIEAGKP